MHVLALAVGEVADLAGAEEAGHLLVGGRVGVVLGEQVDQTGLLDLAAEGDALGERVAGGAFAHHMLARVQRLDGEGGVLVEVVGQDHGVQIVLQEFVVVGVGGHVEFLGHGPEPFLPGVADRHQLHAYRSGRLHERPAATNTDYAYSNRLRHGMSPQGWIAKAGRSHAFYALLPILKGPKRRVQRAGRGKCGLDAARRRGGWRRHTNPLRQRLTASAAAAVLSQIPP